MGRHAAEVHLFGKNIQQKSSKPEGHAVSTSISLRKMKTDMLSIVHLYTRYILPIGWLYATYHQFREPGNFHWHTYIVHLWPRASAWTGREGIRARDQLRKPPWPTGWATARPTLPRLETVLEPPLWFGRLSRGGRGFVIQSSSQSTDSGPV